MWAASDDTLFARLMGAFLFERVGQTVSRSASLQLVLQAGAVVRLLCERGILKPTVRHCARNAAHQKRRRYVYRYRSNHIKAGNGGDGAVAFHREKIRGGRRPRMAATAAGGNVVFVADSNLSTLMDFRYKRKYIGRRVRMAAEAAATEKNARSGDSGSQGTVVRDAQSNLVIADISGDEPVVIAKRWQGRLGQRTLPRRPGRSQICPARAEREEPIVELKLIADVGLSDSRMLAKST